MIGIRIVAAGVMGLCVALHAAEPARAQSYPSKVIKMVVPAGPAGRPTCWRGWSPSAWRRRSARA
jgi:hypothetical protein